MMEVSDLRWKMDHEYADTSRKARALQADQLAASNVGDWKSMEGDRAQRCFTETLLYSQGIFGQYSDFQISYRGTCACSPRSLKQLLMVV